MALRPRGPTLGLGGSFIKDCFWGSSIRVSRKSWHMLLNLCFHMAMTSAIFAGGITLTNYQTVCQAVGITLHYSSLSTLLWMGVKARVLHKELTCRAPPPQEGDSAPPAPRPMLRYMLPMVSFAVGRPQRGA